MTRFDAAIIGAGLAGLRTAHDLASRGWRVLLIDRKPEIGRGIQTTGIFVRRTFDDFELPSYLLGRPIRRVVLHSPGGRSLQLSSDRDEFRVAKMRALYEHQLDRALEEGVVWSPSTYLLDLIANGSRTVVRMETENRCWSVSAKYVIGADGAKSAAARALGLSVNRRFLVGVEDVFVSGADAEPAMHVFLDPKLAPGYIGWLVDDGREIHIGAGGVEGRFHPARALEIFRTKALAAAGATTAAFVERRGGRIPIGGVLPRIVGERGLLVGDAAGAVSPLTAGGIDACFRLSAAAGAIVDGYLRTSDSSLLAMYSGRQLRSRFISRLWMRKAFTMISSAPLLEAACALLRLPLLQPLAQEIFFGRGSFPDLDLSAVHARVAALQIENK